MDEATACTHDHPGRALTTVFAQGGVLNIKDPPFAILFHFMTPHTNRPPFHTKDVMSIQLDRPGVCVSLILLANNCSNNVRELFA